MNKQVLGATYSVRRKDCVREGVGNKTVGKYGDRQHPVADAQLLHNQFWPKTGRSAKMHKKEARFSRHLVFHPPGAENVSEDGRKKLKATGWKFVGDRGCVNLPRNNNFGFYSTLGALFRWSNMGILKYKPTVLVKFRFEYWFGFQLRALTSSKLQLTSAPPSHLFTYWLVSHDQQWSIFCAFTSCS